MTLLLNILGIIVVIGGLYLFSENKNKVNKKLIAKALLAQFIFAFLLVKVMAISLAGFANISSIGICISGISIFCPKRRSEISDIAFKGMIGGFLVSSLSAMIIGLLLLF